MSGEAPASRRPARVQWPVGGMPSGVGPAADSGDCSWSTDADTRCPARETYARPGGRRSVTGVEAADSAGVPFARRSLPDAEFAGDDGGADAALLDALMTYAEQRAAHCEQRLLAALTSARVLVPVVAVAEELAEDGSEKTTDMALVTLVDAAGESALPLFSSVESLQRWRPDARPVPVEGPRAALAAAVEGAEVLLLDLADPWSCAIEGRGVLEALARGRLRVPAYDDDDLAAVVSRAAARCPGIRTAYLVADDELAARVDLDTDTPVTSDDLTALAAALRSPPRPVVRGLGVAMLPDDRTAAGRCVYRRDA